MIKFTVYDVKVGKISVLHGNNQDQIKEKIKPENRQLVIQTFYWIYQNLI